MRLEEEINDFLATRGISPFGRNDNYLWIRGISPPSGRRNDNYFCIHEISRQLIR